MRTLDIVVASCQVLSKGVRWPRNEPTPPSAQAKNSDALGNAGEREHKNACIMPLGSLLAGKTLSVFETQDELERLITESCRSIPNFFGNQLIRYFVPHHGRIT